LYESKDLFPVFRSALRLSSLVSTWANVLTVLSLPQVSSESENLASAKRSFNLHVFEHVRRIIRRMFGHPSRRKQTKDARLYDRP
jgi:hypothetical protein